MEIEIDSKRNNPLLNRTEIYFTIKHKGEGTPNREIIRSELAEKLNVKKENIIVNTVHSSFGDQEISCYAKVYSSLTKSKDLERDYILRRNMLIEPKGKKAEEKPPEAPKEEGVEEKPVEEKQAESIGEIKEHKHLTAHIMNKHKKGGWSQMRFQRLRQESIDHFFQKVLETLEKFIKNEKIAGLVLAGPGEAKDHFKKELPIKLAEQVISIIDYDIDIPTEKLVDEVSLRVSKIEKQKGDEAVKRLRDKVLKTEQGVYGVPATAQAVKEGRAKMLILSSSLKPRGWICERCQIIELGIISTCPNCGNKTSEVDVLEEILEFAERTDAAIEFVDDNPLLEELGGVGAILRY